MIRFSCSADDV